MTIIGMPKPHATGTNGEIVDGIGVPPDYFAPRTAADLSTGSDPGVDKAWTYSRPTSGLLGQTYLG
jgi:carboxyl-terminal processing protease